LVSGKLGLKPNALGFKKISMHFLLCKNKGEGIL
jgi:hypothetical protein